jgi:signal transduction histidine kinase
MRPHADLVRQIPSPARRLWLGLCVILSTFAIFAGYTARKIEWLENVEANVVERNRKSSLQLERLDNDTYLLAISIRDMALGRSAYPLRDWKPVFTRLRNDMENAGQLEGQYAVSASDTSGLRARLHSDLNALSATADHVFALAAEGRSAEARAIVETTLENQRASLTAIVTRLLVMNDQAQAQAARRIDRVYASVRMDILWVTGLLFLLSLGTGLYVFEASRHAFGRMRRLAEQLDTQSMRLRELSWKLIDLQEQTLRQVARDLHDEFGQILTAIGLLLTRAERMDADPELRRELNTAHGVVQETLQKVRDQSQMFRPAVLDDFGLEQTIEWFTRQFSRQAGIPVGFHAEGGETGLSSEEAVHLYRIVQESLNNVARHARASRADVALRAGAEQLSVEIVDDGVGFEAEASVGHALREGLGLIAMRERAEHLKGTLEIQSAPGHGTTVRVCVPLHKAAAAPMEAKVG